ncbi:MAG TPA: hypothetical protein VH120_07180, partial [Gemmataceae bacterium]|nr:hypothetical protein [Gemmataceae bacterium]
YVLIQGVSVRLGSDRSPSPLPYETVKLNRGTIVKIVGDKAFAEGKEWWPIQPPPGDVRYVAKEALSQPTTTVASATPATSVALKPGGSSPTSPLWGQAQQAEQVHDYARAEMLYRQLAGEMAQPGGDHDLAIRCYNRIEQLSRAQTVTWPARQQAPGMLVNSRAVSPTSPPSAAAPPSGSISSGPGWLRRTGIYLEGKPAYVLEDNRGQPRYYLLAAPAQNLDSYVNRAVEVTGPLVRRTDFISGGYISVYRVAVLR